MSFPSYLHARNLGKQLFWMSNIYLYSCDYDYKFAPYEKEQKGKDIYKPYLELFPKLPASPNFAQYPLNIPFNPRPVSSCEKSCLKGTRNSFFYTPTTVMYFHSHPVHKNISQV